jgi:hypothetical protein
MQNKYRHNIAGYKNRSRLSHEEPIDFSLIRYSWLLKKLNNCGFYFHQVSEINKVDEIQKIVYLRHDIDLHVCLVEELAQVESGLNSARPKTVIFPPANSGTSGSNYNPRNTSMYGCLSRCI